MRGVRRDLGVRARERPQTRADKLPGFAQSKDWKPITTKGKVADAPQAREDFQGKPIPIKKSVRGKAVSGAPLTADDLVGSIPKMFYTGV